MAALQAAIDEIADIDQDFLGSRRKVLRILHDRSMHFDHQVGTAVDVADRIDADAGWNARRAAAGHRP